MLVSIEILAVAFTTGRPLLHTSLYGFLPLLAGLLLLFY